MRTARDFQSRPWAEVVRSSDRHPLYPAAVAIAQPAIRSILGDGPDSWRVAGQLVSALASLLILIPLFGLSRSLFDAPAAALAALLFVLLPIPAAVGRDVLADSSALLGFAFALWLGIKAMDSGRLPVAIGCGLAAGLGYLARPEVAVLPMALVVEATARRFEGRAARPGSWRVGVPALAFLTVVGSYAIVKGEVSEKLALRRVAAIPSKHDAPAVARPLPPGLDDPRLDFSAKEESDDPGRMSVPAASLRFAGGWAEAMGFALLPMAIWGAVRVRSGPGRRLIGIYVAIFAAVAVRHAMTFGYLSPRHTLSLVVATLPFASAGILDLAGAVRRRLGVEEAANGLWVRRGAAILAMIALAVGVQFHHESHPSRWGHSEAGRWLGDHATVEQSVLDTRGWATFVSGVRGLDYWHVRQALADPSLAFFVVGQDELEASSRRAETLAAILDYAAEPVAEFPGRKGGRSAAVRVYRFHRPTDWRGMPIGRRTVPSLAIRPSGSEAVR